MAIQQLDLFASFQPEPPAKETQPEPEPVIDMTIAETIIVDEIESVMEIIPENMEIELEPVTDLISENVVSEPAAEDIILVEPAPVVIPDVPAREPVVFADEKIGIRIRPKVFVQQPEPVREKEKVAVLKPKSKRGRKSYKEIDAEVDLIEIPDEETLNQKLYYSITEVARWFRVNASLLRYWENEFDILKPRKNRKGDRLFRPEDIKNLQVIYYLLRNRKFSLEGAKKYLRNHRQQADVHVQLAQSLTKFRSFLLELKANLGA